MFVREPALFTGLCSPPESEIRIQGGGGVVTLWLKDVQRDFHLTVGPLVGVSTQSLPILPLIVRYRTQRPAAPSPACPPPWCWWPPPDLVRVLSPLPILPDPVVTPSSHHHRGPRLTNGRDRSQKVKVEKWQMCHKTSVMIIHNLCHISPSPCQTGVRSSSLILAMSSCKCSDLSFAGPKNVRNIVGGDI